MKTSSRKPKLSEREFQDQVIEYAQLCGWLVHHDRPARSKDGKRWLTHVQGDPGFPDLVLARQGIVIFAELKAEDGKVSAAQEAWIKAANGHSCASNEAVIWRPSNWAEIEEILR